MWTSRFLNDRLGLEVKQASSVDAERMRRAACRVRDSFSRIEEVLGTLYPRYREPAGTEVERIATSHHSVHHPSASVALKRAKRRP